MANSVALMSLNRWIELTERNPDHSSWYVERFRALLAEVAALRAERGGG